MFDARRQRLGVRERVERQGRVTAGVLRESDQYRHDSLNNFN